MTTRRTRVTELVLPALSIVGFIALWQFVCSQGLFTSFEVASPVAVFDTARLHVEKAVELLQDALVLQRAVGHRYGEATALCNMGEAYVELGRYAEAISCEQDALKIVQELGLHRLEGWVLQHLGRAYRDSGRLADGAALIEQALASHRAQGNKLGEAQDLEHLGQAMAQSDRPAEARGLLTRAAELFEEIGEDTQAARIRGQRAVLGRQAGQDVLGVADDRDVSRHVLGDLGRIDVDVDELGPRRELRQLAGDPVVKACPDGDDQICLIHRVVSGPRAMHAEHPEPLGVRCREAPQAHHRARDRQPVDSRQLGQMR